MATFMDKLQTGLLGKPQNYGGLLSAEDQKEAQRQSMIQVGLQLMAAGGPSSQPIGLGQALGGAIGAGQQTQSAMIDKSLNAALLKAQIEKANRATTKPMNVGVGGAIVDPTTGEVIYQNPANPGGQIGNYNPGDYTPESFAKFMQTKDPRDLVRYVAPPNPSVQLINGVPTMVQGSRTGGDTRVDPLSTLPTEANAASTLENAKATGKGQAEADLAAKKKSVEFQQAHALYETARDGLITGLDKTETGPVAGRIPAITAAQQTAEGGVAAMAPVLKQLFRAAGEGVFTDKDQEMLIKMIPTRTDHPEARKAKMENIDAIVKAKLAITSPSTGAEDPLGIR